MADKSFGIKELNLIGASGTPTITSPNNLNLNASNVAISTDVTVGRHLDVDGHAEFDNVNIVGVTTFSSAINVSSSYGTSGQVLTSQGSGSAPQWATASDSIEYHLNEVSGSLPSGGLGITNLPSSIVKLSLVCFNFSGDQNQEFGFRVRANSTELSSNYYWTTMYAGSGGGGDGDYYSNYFATDGLASNGYTCNAIWTLTQGPGNRWFCEAHWNVNPTHSWGYVGTGFGYVDCGASSLDGLSFHPLGGNFDQGDYSLSYLTQT